MLLACFWSYLNINATYSIAKNVGLDFDMALKIEMSKDRRLSKCLPQLAKNFSSIKS